jgi:hypothetical protein
VGAAVAQPFEQLLQQFDLQHFCFTHLTLQQFVSQQLLWQPQPLEPSIRSSNSKPKLWLQVARATTIVERTMFHFIERRLLNDGTVNLAATTPSDTWLRPAALEARVPNFTVGSIPRAIRLPAESWKIVR